MGRVSYARLLLPDDDVSGFDCGRLTLNEWLLEQAHGNHANGGARTHVVCDAETNVIVGYVALSAAQVARSLLPGRLRRNRPDPIPAFLIGRLAVDQTFQRRGVGRALLHHALKTSVHLADRIGASFVLTHPIDENVRAFYARWGFETLERDPKRAMAVRLAELSASGF